MTPAEIVKALRCTATVQTGDEPCESCPFNRTETLTEAQKAQLHCEEWHSCDVDGVALAAADLIERLEKEKAALLESLKASVGNCTLCKHGKSLLDCDGFCLDCGSVSTCSCGTCDQDSKWEWKGLEDEK